MGVGGEESSLNIKMTERYRHRSGKQGTFLNTRRQSDRNKQKGEARDLSQYPEDRAIGTNRRDLSQYREDKAIGTNRRAKKWNSLKTQNTERSTQTEWVRNGSPSIARRQSDRHKQEGRTVWEGGVTYTPKTKKQTQTEGNQLIREQITA